MTWNWNDIFTVVQLGLVVSLLYRLYKWRSRRCPCGCWWYWRSHKIADEGRGVHSSITFRQCFGCRDFVEVKSYDKHFSRFELWWRKTIHPWQFSNVGELMYKARILVDQKAYLAAMPRVHWQKPVNLVLARKSLLPRGRGRSG